MKISTTGEKKILRKITPSLFSKADVIVKAGEDDAACIKLGNEILVLKTDIMFSGTHFPKGMSYRQMGKKVTIANLSDLAAMGARPLAFLASFGFPRNFELSHLKEVINGVNSTCAEYEISFAGGDTKNSKELTIAGFATGTMDNAQILKRSNVRPGHLIAVTGNIGSAACGMLSLLKNQRVPREIADAFLEPGARIKEGRILSESRIGAGAMDITDGLFYSVNELSQASKVRIDVSMSKIPVQSFVLNYAKKHKISLMNLLNIGEDYELLVSIPKGKFAAIRNKLKNIGSNIYPIGHAKQGNGIYLDNKKINPEGYDAFIKRL